MFRKVLYDCLDYFKTANIYIRKSQDTIEIQQNQLIATRLFIVLFLSSLIGLVGYASLTLKLTNIQIKNPSQSTFEKLYVDYSEVLSCPCSQTSIQIRKFVNINVSYHQICSSIFVTDDFISSIFNTIPTLYYSLDIRRMISSQLQLLASYCHSSQMTVTDTLNVLLSDQLFIPTMISRDEMNSQIDILVTNAKENTINRQRRNGEFIRSFIQANLFFSALSNNFLYMNINNARQGFYSIKYLQNATYPPNIVNDQSFMESDLCYCTDSANCTYPSGIYPTLTGFDSYRYYGVISPPMISLTQIQGLYTGCMPFESTMISTLECFYDNDCLLKLFSNIDHLQSLNIDVNDVYLFDTQISLLMEQLFIESVSITKDFESFYSECKPMKCIYSYSSRGGNAASIVLTILSLIGGLFVVLRKISMVSVKLYQKLVAKCSNRSSNDEKEQNKFKISICKKISLVFKTLSKKISEKILNYNLFERAHNDEYKRNTEILSTRLYILLMIVGLIVIILYASIIPYTLTYNIESPSINTYRQFVDEYPDLTCECQRTVTNFSLFISFSPRFHQFCSSEWTQNFLNPHFSPIHSTYPITGFTMSITHASGFLGGRVLCNLGKEIVSDSIAAYLKTTYLSTYLTHENEFLSSMNISIRNMRTSLPAAITPFVLLLQDIAQGNQLLSGVFSNAKISYNISSIDEDNKIKILSINPFNKSCSCSLSSDSCRMSYDDFCNHTYSGMSTELCGLPYSNVFIACEIIYAWIPTTTKCFYNETCVRLILSCIPSYNNINITSLPISRFLLNPNLTSRYPINSSVLAIMNELAIEEWNDNINYESYYKNCNPKKCFYMITKNLHISTVITTVVGLFGGLSAILKILIPPVIKFLRWIRRVKVKNTETTFQG